MAQKRMSNRRRMAGVTLLECIAVIVIVGTSLVAGISLFSFQGTAYLSEKASWKAVRFLSREMERVHATDFDSLELTNFEPVAEDPAYEVRRVVKSIKLGHPGGFRRGALDQRFERGAHRLPHHHPV